MLTYKQRYKPRTEREYTKSDLTVYDSAGNTALNTLKVYGKSEIVDGAIKSAGEGYAVVRLADLTWIYSPNATMFYASVSSIMNNTVAQKICSTMLCDNETAFTWDIPVINRTIYSTINDQKIFIKDTNYTTVEDFVASLGGATLCYELADPSQGNCIAIKTDDGTGINGTMATFATGTPLYGVSDTVRDFMEWDGSAGTVTKKCAKVNFSDLTWYWNSTDNAWQTNTLQNSIKTPTSNNIKPPPYITPNNYAIVAWTNSWDDKTTSVNMAGTLMIKDSNYDSNTQPDFDIIYELATPTTEQLTQAENESIASLRTFDGTTHFTNNASTDMTVNYTIKVPTI